MDPAFEHYRPAPNSDVVQVNTRVPVELRDLLDAIKTIEGGSVADLIVEGVARVIEARGPEVLAEDIEAQAEQKRQEIAFYERRLAQLAATAPNPKSPTHS